MPRHESDIIPSGASHKWRRWKWNIIWSYTYVNKFSFYFMLGNDLLWQKWCYHTVNGGKMYYLDICPKWLYMYIHGSIPKSCPVMQCYRTEGHDFSNWQLMFGHWGLLKLILCHINTAMVVVVIYTSIEHLALGILNFLQIKFLQVPGDSEKPVKTHTNEI